MEPKCSVCTHQYRKAIDLELASGSSARKVAVQYLVSQTAMQRHKLKHLIAKAKQVAVQQAVHRAKQAEKVEQRHQEAVANIWETRLERAYHQADDGAVKALADPDKWYLGAQFIGQAIKACGEGMRATGAIGDGGTTINVGQMLVLPQSQQPQQLPGPQPALIESGDIIDADTE